MPENNAKIESWDLSQERQFGENLANQRFNFFIVFYGLIVAATVTSNIRSIQILITTFGLLMSIMLAITVRRSFETVNILISQLREFPNHPVRFIADKKQWQPNKEWMRSNQILGTWLPLVCILSLAILLLYAIFHPST
jgi:hypothetical protein